MKKPSHLAAILQTILVTFLWSTSFVLIKIGLREELPAISFAGLRYGMAFLCLVPLVAFNPRERAAIKQFTRKDWLGLVALGLVLYAITQGFLYLSLDALPAALVSLVLNLTPIFVGFTGILFLKERPALLQWLGVALALCGVVIYFLPFHLSADQTLGIPLILVCLVGNVAGALLGRGVNRGNKFSPLLITCLSMGIGAALMLLAGGLTRGFGKPGGTDWLIIAWMAVLNTALAFTLWNNSLRTLSAVESAILNSLMLPQTVLLAFLFLSETPSTRELVGLGLVFSGVLVSQVQGRKNRKLELASSPGEETAP